MKIYSKQYEDLFQRDNNLTFKTESAIGPVDGFIDRFRGLMREADHEIFRLVVNFVWLELQFIYNGRRREARSSNSIQEDKAFSYFMRADVGTGHKTLTSNLTFTIISTYLKDFFPDFLNHDPSIEPEYFSFPYKYVSLEHMAFVYKMKDRMEMLEYAEERAMRFMDFANWAVNQALCYNDEIGRDMYTITKAGYHWTHINNVDIGKQWFRDNFNFENYEYTEEIEASGLHDELF